jgi:multidrug transporter EmrE-like cation transporter
MSPLGLCLIAICAAMTMAANLLLRAGIGRAGGFNPSGPVAAVPEFFKLLAQPLFAIGFVVYFIAALVWFRTMAIEPLATAYPVLAGLTFVMVSAGAMLVFREPLSVQKIVGLGLILIGVAVASFDQVKPPP